MDSDSDPSPAKRPRTSSDASDYIQSAQRLTREEDDEATHTPTASSEVEPSSSGMTESDKPEMILTHLSREEMRSVANSYKIFELAQAMKEARKGSKSNSDISDEFDDDSLEDTSISDFHDSEVEDDMREAPIETFVKSTRIVYPNGDEKYISGSKDS